MTTQNYLEVNTENVVDNIIIWDGDINTWTPPDGYTMLVKSTTPALIWKKDKSVDPPVYVLVEVIGAGSTGFTWDKTTQILTTNQPDPNIPVTNLI
jgi:hypothetical protein